MDLMFRMADYLREAFGLDPEAAQVHAQRLVELVDAEEAEALEVILKVPRERASQILAHYGGVNGLRRASERLGWLLRHEMGLDEAAFRALCAALRLRVMEKGA